MKEIYDMLEGQSVVLGPDGKVLDFNSGNTVSSGVPTSDNSSNTRTCKKCKFFDIQIYISQLQRTYLVLY